MTQLQQSRNLTAKAQTFDWWFSQYPSLYKILLATILAKRLRKALPYIRGPRVLEVSFGTGYLMSKYAGKFETVGIDYNPRYLQQARQRLADCQVQATLIKADAHALPFADDSFHCLVNTDAFTLYSDSRQVMREFYRVLAPGGRLILMEHNYPKNGNWLGTFRTNWARLTMPYVAFDELLADVGFEYEDHDVGASGWLHMYVATKPLKDGKAT